MLATLLGVCSLLGFSALNPHTELSINQTPIKAEVASDPGSRKKGLQNRLSLPDGSGMLFVFPDSEIQSFWMKETFVPLSVGFFDKKGALINIEDMPIEPGPHYAVYKSLKPAQYALEVPLGWFEHHNIQVGMKLEGLDQIIQ